MAGKWEIIVSEKHHMQLDELSSLTMSNDKIMESIYATHVHVHGDHDKFDVHSLFIHVKNILMNATQIVDNAVQGTRAHVEHIDVKNPKASLISSPLCILKKITCELSCKAPGEEIAHRTTLSILNKLSCYSWDAKAVLTLAAFALDYGEFWLLSRMYQSDQLAKSLAVLKQVPVLQKPSAMEKHRRALMELNNLIKATLQVIECIFELVEFSHFHLKLPALSTAMDHIPVDVYGAIKTLAACATKITILTSNEDREQDLSVYSYRLHCILNNLKKQLLICKKQISGTG
ncbi:hypothetical protein FNV43_RR01536 [Rhamnella rubrinervis]|uniref:Sieve element occlusion N-terminal domain-containing protein n=1 Tax=Rhamnella rubrinervis TaxID=2594499 RepID=A0A8K0HQ06_9ROSA|nr:hypothetical protein FNV43_RR01536 [Rhamnella rubrinervis]